MRGSGARRERARGVLAADTLLDFFAGVRFAETPPA